MSEGEVVVLDFWVSPFCMRVKIALNEKGVSYEAREEDLFGGKSELLIKSNPVYQKVPVFLHDGKPLSESVVIVGYIDETWPSPALLPPCPYGRAQARFWADYIDKRLFDALGGIWRSKGEDTEVAKKDFIEILKVLEGALGEKDFFGGESFGFVDIIAIPLTCWFLAVEKLADFSVESECPKFAAWIKRCMQRESVAKIIPDPEKVYEFVLMMRKMHGIN
ncbi:probable glutathione S-transferase [Ricinus communis]|uniref:glutathione transferase n=1 Tax=Ricinus communis TaxID=3988 RepID=B9SKR6_RICCO|nr:probable glutathione S-transferase [Ricinus communis]EEF35797.1 glutathione s-transferase, putative [Ricinus communis]|eukprot:XP_002526585.1 probable glutathione S-transferase [Ricinus communis]